MDHSPEIEAPPLPGAANREPSRLDRFQSELISSPPLHIVRRFITFGDCFALPEGTYFDLKAVLAAQFSVHPNEVVMVGSGKLGFSIAPDKRFREFCDESDIDIAIVSKDLFDAFWLEAFRYSNEVGPWSDLRNFRSYLFRGWIQPDYLPPSESFPRRRDWFEFFRQLNECGRFGRCIINAGIYRSWAFLEEYQVRSVSQCADAMRTK